MSAILLLPVPHSGPFSVKNSTRLVGHLRRIFFASLIAAALCAAMPRIARAQSVDEIVRKVVHNELDADFNDHTSWMYRDAYKSPDKNIVKIVVETSQGNLSEIVEDNGHPPSAEEHRNDLSHMQQIV